MSEFTRIFSIAILLFLSFFCFVVGIFLYSGHNVKQNGRHALILLELLTGALLLFDALSYYYRGNTTMVGYYMVRISNFFVFSINQLTSFFLCFYVCEFIMQSHLDFALILKPRESLRKGIPVQLFIVLLFCIVALVLIVISQCTHLFYYFDEHNLYHRNALYPVSVVFGFIPGLITLTMFLQHRKNFATNVFVSLLVYFLINTVGIILILFVYGFSWVNIALGLGVLHLFFSSVKLMEIEFYSGKTTVLSPSYTNTHVVYVSQKKLIKNHFWQTLSAALGGLLIVLGIVSITGVQLPEKTLVIDHPYTTNTVTKPVCVTFIHNAEKHWIDEGDPDREGAQYDGIIFNNMSSTVITDWHFSINIPDNCSIDPGPWNGNFSIADGQVNVRKPQEGDQENIHGTDFYAITPLKTLGFGCIMYAPLGYQPLDQKITFTYSCIVKPLLNVFFDIFIAILFIIFIISTTIMLFTGKLVKIEEENRKLEATVKERTKELEEEKNRSESLLLNILPEEIAEELKAHPNQTIAKEYPNVTVLFTDIVGFTKISGALSAEEVVTLLNKMFSMFDDRAKREGIEKIKTIGDAYMAATGLTEEKDNDGAKKMFRFASGLLNDVITFNESSPIKMLIRVGINSGPLVAGVIGKTKFIYDIWGDTVNVASRMESTGIPMRIHITEGTKNQISDILPNSESVEIEVKGKGMMNTYFI